MAKIIFASHKFFKQPADFPVQGRKNSIPELDCEGFPAGYLYLELKQPYELDGK